MIPGTSLCTETADDLFCFPSEEELVAEQTREHGIPDMFGYSTTMASDSLCAGFGERFYHPLAPEENTFQLQGMFPAAALNFAKLKARIEARNGDTDALNEIFARMWGLDSGMVSKIPPLHVEGTDSQPKHHRPYPWEKLLRDVLASKSSASSSGRYSSLGFAMASRNDDHLIDEVIKTVGEDLSSSMKRMADIVSREASQAVTRTIDLLLEHNKERAKSTNQDAEDYANPLRSRISNAYEVPRYKAVGSSINRGISSEYMGPGHYADITSHNFNVFSKKAKSRGGVFTLGSVQLPDHPWGDLVQDLPGSYHEMLQFTMNLDPAGWTLPPDYLQSIFRKGISELWSDICTEIEQVMTYLYEIESGAVEIQDEILAGESSHMLP